MLLLPDHGLLFIHVPKSAGTSVKNAICRALDFDRWEVLHEYGLAEHGTLAEARMRIPPKLFHRLTVFGVLRDPIDRLLSFWRFGRQWPPEKQSRIIRGLRHLDALPDEAKTALRKRHEDCGLDEWLRFCTYWGWDPWLQTQQRGRSVVQRAQVEWFDCMEKPATLFRSDDLGSLERWLAARGLNASIRRENATEGEDAFVSEPVRQWATDVFARDYQRLAAIA